MRIERVGEGWLLLKIRAFPEDHPSLVRDPGPGHRSALTHYAQRFRRLQALRLGSGRMPCFTASAFVSCCSTNWAIPLVAMPRRQGPHTHLCSLLGGVATVERNAARPCQPCRCAAGPLSAWVLPRPALAAIRVPCRPLREVVQQLASLTWCWGCSTSCPSDPRWRLIAKGPGRRISRGSLAPWHSGGAGIGVPVADGDRMVTLFVGGAGASRLR